MLNDLQLHNFISAYKSDTHRAFGIFVTLTFCNCLSRKCHFNKMKFLEHKEGILSADSILLYPLSYIFRGISLDEVVAIHWK